MKLFSTKILLSFLFILYSASYGYSTEISLNPSMSPDGKSLQVPVLIDQTDNLAGVKIGLQYSSENLKYNNIKKSKKTSPLMHIVNSKKPGKLIVVMAGAKGIKGKNLELFNLTFDVIKKPYDVKITNIELMSDTLKAIKCNIKQNKSLKTKKLNKPSVSIPKNP